jgi:hypothetical protein
VRTGGRLRRVVARTAVLGLLVGGGIAMSAISAGADSPNPGSNNGGTGVTNADGSITVTVHGSWVWTGKSCDEKKIPGWAVDWGDNTANPLFDGSPPGNGVYVGDANDNTVHVDTTYTCDDSSGDAMGDFDTTQTHTYAAGTDPATISACIVTYHLDDKSETGKHSAIAGGPDRNTDNSIEENDGTIETCPVIPIEVSPAEVVNPPAPPAPLAVQPAFPG